VFSLWAKINSPNKLSCNGNVFLHSLESYLFYFKDWVFFFPPFLLVYFLFSLFVKRGHACSFDVLRCLPLHYYYLCLFSISFKFWWSSILISSFHLWSICDLILQNKHSVAAMDSFSSTNVVLKVRKILKLC